MPTLTDIEDALLARAETALGTTVRTYAPLPGGRSGLAEVLSRTLLKAPAVCAAWGGDEKRVSIRGGSEVWLTGQYRAQWSLFAISQSPAGELVRRRGRDTEPVAIGTYAMVETLTAALDGWTIAGIGTVRVEALRALDGPVLAEMATSIAEVVLSIDHGLDTGLDLTGLDDFLRFVGEIDLAPADGTAEASVWLEREADESFPLVHGP